MSGSLDRFLDDDNIIKKDDKLDNIEFTVEPFDEEREKQFVQDQIVTLPNIVEKQKKKKNSKTVAVKEERKPKTERDILIDLIDKYNIQYYTKKIDLELEHFLYNEGGSNEERSIHQKMIDNLAKDIRLLEKKLEFLNKKQ